MLPEVKHKPAKAVVARPISKLRMSVPSDMSCKFCPLTLWNRRFLSANTLGPPNEAQEWAYIVVRLVNELQMDGSVIPHCLLRDWDHSMCCNWTFSPHPCWDFKGLACDHYILNLPSISNKRKSTYFAFTYREKNYEKAKSIENQSLPLFSQQWLPLTFWFGPWSHICSFFFLTT